jgi:hypothetical protein
MLMNLEVTWQINSENVSTFGCTFLLANNLKISISPYLTGESQRMSQGAECGRRG